MSKYGLKESEIKKINEVFASFPELEEAVLYGSRAKGNYRPGSDIDLTIKGKNLNLNIVNKISSKIDELMLPYITEISLYKNINNPDLIEHINRAGIVFYKKKVLINNEGMEEKY